MGGRIVGVWTWYRAQRRITRQLFANSTRNGRRALRHPIGQIESFLRSEI